MMPSMKVQVERSSSMIEWSLMSLLLNLSLSVDMSRFG